MGKRGAKRGTKYHSDYEKAAGVLLLSINQNDYAKTAEMLGVTSVTIHNWEKETLSKKLAIPQMIEIAIHKLLENMPTTWTGNSWAVAFGIMMDKWLLVNGQPTERKESILANVDELPEDKKDAVIAEAERIIAEATSRGTHTEEI